MITYDEISEYISHMTVEQRAATATVSIGAELFPVHHMELSNDQEEDRLDDGHPVLVVLENEEGPAWL